MFSIEALATSVIGGLILAAIVWYISQRRLYVVVPKLFAYSSLVSKSKTVELTILNRGYRSEEKVKIEFDPKLSYEQLASTNPAVKLIGSTLEIDRVSANDEVTVLIVVEGGEFGTASIASISSSECKGAIVEKLENVPLSFGTSVGGIATAITLIVFFIWLGWIARGTSAWEVLEDFGIRIPPPTHIQEDGWENAHRFSGSKLYNDSEVKAFPVEIKAVRHNDSQVEVDLEIQNYGDKRLEISVCLTSPGLGRAGSEYGLMLLPGQAVKRTLIAEDVIEDMHIIYIEVNFTYDNEFVYELIKELNLNK